MFLEIATTLGALFGAFLSSHIPTGALSIIFGLILLQAHGKQVDSTRVQELRFCRILWPHA